MSLWSRLTGRETRRETVRLSDPYLAEFFGQRGGLAGFVDTGRATGLATAHAAITCIAQNLAAMPCNLYRRMDDGGRERATDHPLHGVLHDAANPQATAYEAREFLTASILIYGNAFARIEWSGRGQVTGLYPLHPLNVSVERLESGRLRYRVTGHRGETSILTQDETLHLRWRIGPDGVTGLSPIQIARETFNLGLTQQDTAGRQAGKSFRPEGVLSFPTMLGREAGQNRLDALGRKVEDVTSAGGILVLDGGATWNPLAFSSKDAEFLESRKLTDLAIARIFSVPPTAIGITDNATYSNVDGESRALVMRCLAPMARRIEQAMNAALLPVTSRRTFFVEHDLAGLLRGDLTARFEAYRVGREAGFLSPNEIRRWENLPVIEGGDTFLQPLNMGRLGDPPATGDGSGDA